MTELTQFADNIRLHTLKSLAHLGFGHFGGSLSIVEALAVLYGKVMKIDPTNPQWEGRDYFVLSKGHGGPALYATLALKGFFPLEQLYTLNQNGTSLPSHPDRLKTLGVDATTGSLGQGISIAAGIALSHQLRQLPNRTFCLLGDGELNEGQCWEAFQFIAHRQLTHLTILIDYNRKQLDGELCEIINPFDLVEKFNSFGFNAHKVKGDDMVAIEQLLIQPTNRPLVIILDTQKGQGVPYFEAMGNCHHLRLDDTSRAELNQIITQLEAKNAD